MQLAFHYVISSSLVQPNALVVVQFHDIIPSSLKESKKPSPSA